MWGTEWGPAVERADILKGCDIPTKQMHFWEGGFYETADA